MNYQLVDLTIDIGAIEAAGRDPRLEMEWSVVYRRIDPGQCTFCQRRSFPEASRKRRDLTISREPHLRREKGYLYSRCPDHQPKY